MGRFHKAPKHEYRFVITSGEKKPQKKQFRDYSDGRARAKLFRKLHQLPRGSKIVLYRLEEKTSEWSELPCRGGRD